VSLTILVMAIVILHHDHDAACAEDMARFVERYPELKAKSHALGKHMTLAQHLANEVEARCVHTHPPSISHPPSKPPMRSVHHDARACTSTATLSPATRLPLPGTVLQVSDGVL